MRHNNLEWWLNEQDIPAAAGQPDPAGGQPPAGDATPMPQMADPNQGQPPQQDPNIANQDQQQQAAQPQPTEPESPDMPQEKEKVNDFEVWKHKYIKESIKGDTNKLVELLTMVRDHEGLSPYQRKFVEDNWNIQMVRMHSNVDKASKQIRRNIKDQLDRNNPSTSVMNHIAAVMETIPLLNTVFIKLNGYAGLKGDLHRKYIGALVGAVQVGSGSNTEDLIYAEKEYSILLSTRFNSRWGDVMIGNWSLREDDAERHLEEPELKRLQEGSPQEKDALRRRIVIESIADLFEHRAFLIHVVGDDGTIYALGWDVASSLRAAFTEGKLVVKTRHSDNSEAMITDDGKIVPLVDININYVKETNEQDDEGKPATKEFRFMERRDGTLFFVADMTLIRECTSNLQGFVLKEIPYQGNPSDLERLVRCVYDTASLIMRNC
jgi:hypothetical protein